MPVKEILLLGNPKLYEISQPIKKEELEKIKQPIQDLHDTLMDFRAKHNCGRAIAAPQIGVMKRLIYMFIDEPRVFINPIIENPSIEMIELWDDCMSFPNLLVKVSRHETIELRYRNEDWQEKNITLKNDLSELLQHECDHLDGILAVARAIDETSFAFKSQQKYLE